MGENMSGVSVLSVCARTVEPVDLRYLPTFVVPPQ